MQKEEDENLSYMIDEEDGKKYQFDFQAQLKLKKRARTRTYILISIIIILVAALIAMFVMYANKGNNNTKPNVVKVLSTKEAGKAMVKLIEAKKEAYYRIAKYGENCHNSSSNGTVTVCSKNSFCRRLQHTYRCDCYNGYVGDGIGECQDASFSINFKNPTKENIPELRRVVFPKTDAISVCFWFKLDTIAYATNKWMAVFMFTSVEIPGENDLMIWIKKDELHVYMKSKGKSVHQKAFKMNKWSHLCWLWEKTGNWWVYVDGLLASAQTTTDTAFTKSFPESSGNLLLGQDKDEDLINQSIQMFHGTMTQFYIYSKRLTGDEVVSLYENRPPIENVVVGWWQFKNYTKGNDIVLEEFPNQILIHKTKSSP